MNQRGQYHIIHKLDTLEDGPERFFPTEGSAVGPMTAGWVDSCRQVAMRRAHGWNGSNHHVELFIAHLYLHFTVETYLPERINGRSGCGTAPGARTADITGKEHQHHFHRRRAERKSGVVHYRRRGNVWCNIPIA